MDLGEQPLAGQGVEVAADRHVADPELARQLLDAHRAVALDVGGDQLAAPAGEDTTPERRALRAGRLPWVATIRRPSGEVNTIDHVRP